MTHFAKDSFGKYTSLIFSLLLISVLEFIGLAGILVSDSQAKAEASAAQQETDNAADAGGGELPEWLEPAEDQIAEKPKPEGESDGPDILARQQIITHGLGAVGQRTVLNCLEGFQTMYEQGVRVFEADLRMTSDYQVVLRHDWRQGWQKDIRETNIPTLDEFLNTPILGKYTPLSFSGLLLLLEEYPDVCIITDSKFIEAESVRMQFDAMLQDAADLGLSYLLDRFVVQVYSPLMFRVVDSVHHFKGYIYTMYMEGFDSKEDTFRQRASFCAENGILGITMQAELWDGAYAPIAEKYGITVYTHTVNDPEQARILLESGISGVYTDSLTPAALRPETQEAAAGDAGVHTNETNEEGDAQPWS